MSSIYTNIFPPPPIFTESSIIDLSSKVFLITHAHHPTALALAAHLYALHSTIYLHTPTQSHYTTLTKTLNSACPASKGYLKPFIADFTNLRTITPAVGILLAEEYRLDVLFLGLPEGNEVGKDRMDLVDGHDPDLTHHCLAPFLLTTLLLPLMQNVATHFCHPNTSIRVVWTTSLLHSPPPTLQIPSSTTTTTSPTHGPLTTKSPPLEADPKALLYLLAQEFSRRPPAQSTSAALRQNPHNVLHISLDPSLPHSTLRSIMSAMLQRGKNYEAYTALYAGLAPGLQQGDFVVPWGRKGSLPERWRACTKGAEDGTKSVSATFYEWCEEQVQLFL